MNFLRRMFETKRSRYAALGVVIAIAAGVGVWLTHAYTIAVVDGTSIPISEFYKNYRAAALYYENVQKSYEANNKELPQIEDQDIKASVLSQLVEAVLVDHAAQAEVGSDLSKLVDERIATYRDNTDLATASKALYGLSQNDFTEEVLVPQAKQDILRGRLFLKNQSLEDWLSSAKKNATVHIFSKDFGWDGNQIVAN